MVRRLRAHVNKTLIGISLIAFLCGCTPDAYRRDADLQVDNLLKDRKQTTLGYTPKTVVKSEDAAPPTKKSYAKIPATPIPPPMKSPMEPVHFELPFGPLGPPGHSLGIGNDAQTNAPGFQTADLQRESVERLRLGPPAAGPQAVAQLDLFRPITYAVQHGRDYQSQMEDMYIKTLDVLLQRHAFEPQPFLTQGLQYTRGTGALDTLDSGRSAWRYTSALAATNTVGVRQRLPMGGDITAKALMEFTDALNDNTSDGESGQVAITGTIPLLRGAGMVNLEPLIQSERELVY